MRLVEAVRSSVWRLIGAGVLAFSVLPMYRMLDHPDTGFAGGFTAGFTDIHFEFVWYGALLMLPVALACAVLLPRHTENALVQARRRVGSIRYDVWLGASALLTLALGSLFSLTVLKGQPNLIDSFAQVLHARYWSEGRLAGPLTDEGFWTIQNSLVTDRGWVSQYPPGHVAILTGFLRLGVPWLAGPFMMAVTVLFTGLAAQRLFPARPAMVRIAVALLAVSPLFIVIGASYMNHVTAAALVSVGAWALLMAWQRSSAWALLAGAGFGWALATRPLSTVAMASVLTLTVPFAGGVRTAPRFWQILGLTAVGSLPFVVLLLWYNAHFFGDPGTFGYEIAMGPQMRLGFLRDPWGNVYGLREAIGYTTADIMALGVNLFESPVSATVIIGLFLMLSRRLSAAERVVGAWALAPVFTNFFYWHHGNFMGPRMLYEALPAWVLLFVAAAAFFAGERGPIPATGKYNARLAARGVLIGSLAFGLLFMAPRRAMSYGGSWFDIARVPVPEVPGPALVFVHDAWAGRINMTLSAARYRLDLIETLYRQNSTCKLQGLADAVLAGDSGAESRILGSLDTIPRAIGNFPPTFEIAPGDNIRVGRNEVLTPDCVRHARSDRFGILDLAPLIWRGDLPGSPARGVLFARDMGPVRNARLIAQHRDRQPWIYMLPDPDSDIPQLLEYNVGMQLLWGATHER